MNPTVLERLSKFAGKLLGASVNLSPKNGTVAQKGFTEDPFGLYMPAEDSPLTNF